MNDNDLHHVGNAAAAARKAVLQYAKKHRIGPDFGLYVHAIGALVCDAASQIDDAEQADALIQFLMDSLSAGLSDLVSVSFTRTDCVYHEPTSELH